MQATRERILAEATRQLTELGYARFAVAGVRDALGLSSGSMFHAFASKAALAAAVYAEGMAAYQRAALASGSRPTDPARALRALVDHHLAWIEEHRPLARYLFSTPPDEVMSAAATALASHNQRFYEALAALFERAADAGLMGRLERPLAWALCIGPAHEYGRLWTRGEAAASPRELSRLFQDAALASLAATVRTRTRARARKESKS